MKDKQMTQLFRLFFGSFFLIWLICFSVYVVISTLAMDYALWAVVDKDLPLIGDIILGTIFGSIAIPVTVFCWLYEAFGGVLPLVAG